jgi:hypothetical protein
MGQLQFSPKVLQRVGSSLQPERGGVLRNKTEVPGSSSKLIIILQHNFLQESFAFEIAPPSLSAALCSFRASAAKPPPQFPQPNLGIGPGNANLNGASGFGSTLATIPVARTPVSIPDYQASREHGRSYSRSTNQEHLCCFLTLGLKTSSERQ